MWIRSYRSYGNSYLYMSVHVVVSKVSVKGVVSVMYCLDGPFTENKETSRHCVTMKQTGT